jgi:hypothetical protein
VVVTNNYDVANHTVSFSNDGLHSSVLNITTEYKKVVTRYKADVKIMTQMNKDDKNFERELFKTNLDVGKAFKGIHGNFFVRGFFENYAKSADFELKLPFQKVNRAKHSNLSYMFVFVFI